jgi:hypothetical protein
MRDHYINIESGEWGEEDSLVRVDLTHFIDFSTPTIVDIIDWLNNLTEQERVNVGLEYKESYPPISQ